MASTKAATTRAMVMASAAGSAPLAICARIASRTASGPGARRGLAKCAAIPQTRISASNEPSRAAISRRLCGIVEQRGVQVFGRPDQGLAADFGDDLEQRARIPRLLGDRSSGRAVEIAPAIDFERVVVLGADAGAN